MAGVVVVGAGPGIGAAVARRFAREGMPVGLVARRPETLDAVAATLPGVPVGTATADVTDEVALRTALATLADRFGTPDAVVYNAALIRPDRPGELSVREHERAWAVNVVGALVTATAVAPAMARRGYGTVLVTGGMPAAVPAYVSLSLGKAGVRALVELLDREYGPAGVHVATVRVDGPVAPGTDFDPDDIADEYWRVHAQPRGHWDREVAYPGG
ncbi:SDR family NAD(P)-dependent oxidoreductase [Actinocatenispora rupis]|uniref:Short-chain dehydrogenase n=1 Tax=Actinocatenispora rupis TaxID=519421 RepID=A0A8J3NBI2_9ACTN|nr:SDR family NAD(P)-dependent oxidoreductase [Actinocatenispora rupis]GID10820.1 hypothetical protein Aru02nite_17090 [Actinocatenispora rupis]